MSHAALRWRSPVRDGPSRRLSPTYAKPWSIRFLLHRDKQPGARITEDECLEGADGRWHHISPFDSRAVAHHDYDAEIAAEAKSAASK